MDIKSKSYNKNRGWRILAFILCVVFLVAAFTTAALGVKSISELDGAGVNVEDVLFYPSYKESMSFQWEFESKIREIAYLIGNLKSVDYIKSGQALNQDERESRIENLFSQKVNYDETGTLYEQYNGFYEYPSVRVRFAEDHADEVQLIEEEMIANQLKSFEERTANLSENKGFRYYAMDGVNTMTNVNRLYPEIPLTGEEFEEMVSEGEYLIHEDGKVTKASPGAEFARRRIQDNDGNSGDRFYNLNNPDLKVYLAFEKDFLADREAAFKEAKAEVFKWIPIVVACLLISLAAMVSLIVLTGRKDEEGNRPVYRIDRIFTELQLTVMALCFFGGGAIFLELLFDSIYYNPYPYVTSLNGPMLIQMAVAVLVGLFSASIGLLFLLACVRNLKSGRFLKNMLLYRLFKAIWDGIRAIYHGGSVMRKVVLITLVVCLLSATVVLAPAVAILILALAPKWVKKYEEIRKGVTEVRNGNLSYKIPLSGEGELDQLAAEINDISAASNIAIQNELKNQRLKADLISNVSHDLKTPLTSIITYIDLLKAEGLDSENAPQYLKVLDEKSMRLQKLTEDLFDAAKASSGAIPVRLEKVDMLSLIHQGLGEMAAGIEASDLDFIVSAKEERYYVHADGQLLWRVVENLLGNVLKYALSGSRVYINLQEVPGVNGKEAQILMEIKNISRAELNIAADELMERFKRGDESRTTEGSGLGLAIAKDLVTLQKGWFEIRIDGDLFKALVMLPRARDEEFQ